jgi:hypothetical protein
MRITRIIRRAALAALALAAAALVASFAADRASPASAAKTTTVQQAASQNWAGYVLTGRGFSSVSGTWTQPQARGRQRSGGGYSAFWVGLGGSSSHSRSLEQVGTASDYVNGHAEYYAWYELVPAGQVKLNLSIHPGDEISGKVTVNDDTVTVSLSDQTTGKSVVKTVQMNHPATSSAEWIAEAPASDAVSANTRILPLADFGKVTFRHASASAGGHTGEISDSHWTATRMQLRSGASSATPGGAFPDFVAPGRSQSESTYAATTSTLKGDSFSVTWHAATGGVSGPTAGQFPDAASPGGDPSGPAGNGYGPSPTF